jgi:NifB/MoaA-like Fe-S oxidoreductase
VSGGLEQQLVNELRHLLTGINEKYKGFFHINLLTLVDMKEGTCENCTNEQQQCLRCVVGVKEQNEPQSV